ncbi:MAG: hypothetical protein ACI9LE_002210, partial [Paraglaciecola sp.]
AYFLSEKLSAKTRQKPKPWHKRVLLAYII